MEKLTLQANGKGFNVINNSPYFTVANIGEYGQASATVDSLMVAPFSTQFAASKRSVRKNVRCDLMYIDDLGAYKSKAITAH